MQLYTSQIGDAAARTLRGLSPRDRDHDPHVRGERERAVTEMQPPNGGTSPRFLSPPPANRQQALQVRRSASGCIVRLCSVLDLVGFSL